MNETSKATVFTLLHNYEEYGDDVMIHNGRIVRIVAGKKKGTATPGRASCAGAKI